MESYVEITWLINGIFIAMATLLGTMLDQHTVNVALVIKVSFLYSLYLMLADATWWMLVIGELVFWYLIAGRLRGSVFYGLLIRILVIQTLDWTVASASAGFIWYVPIDATYRMLIMIPVFLVFLLLLPNISIRCLKRGYCYPVELHLQDLIIKANGYLDSGNVATYQNIPIIFLSARACLPDLIKSLECMEGIDVTIRTLHGRNVICCYEAELKIPGYQRRKVLVGLMEDLRIQKGCDVLLNVKVFQVK